MSERVSLAVTIRSVKENRAMYAAKERNTIISQAAIEDEIMVWPKMKAAVY